MPRSLHVAALIAAGLVGASAPPADAAGLGLKRCGDKVLRSGGFRCAKVVVPNDYANPAAGTMRIAAAVRRAKGPKRLGPLFFNFGGPGASSVESAAGFAASLPRSVRRRFDLVAVDPRGTGGSRPAISCKVDQRSVGLYSRPTQRPGRDDATYDARVQTYVDRCVQRNAAVAPYVGSANVARDMDLIRDRLGAPKLTYIGFSYGTLLGATYMKLFPGNYRASILDGVVNPDAWYNRPHDGLLSQTAGFEDALNRFLAASAKSSRSPRWIGGKGKDPRAAFDALIAKAAAKPLKSHTKGDRTGVDGDEVLNATTGLLYAKQLWPELQRVLNEVSKGNGRSARQYSDEGLGGRRKDGTYGPSLDRYFVISAADQPYEDNPALYQTWGLEAAQLFPHFSSNVGYTEAHYGRWPIDGVGVDRGPFTLPPTAAEALVIGTTHDPATPYADAQSTTTLLGRARLLTMDGDGHTAFGQGSACIDRAFVRYLLTTNLPAIGKRCRQNLPFPLPTKRPKSAAATPHGAPGYLSPIRSTTKTSVSSGPMTPPAPRLP